MSEYDPILDAELRAHDPDRWLSSRFVTDPATRARLVALYTLDNEWARVRGLARTPFAGEIRLAWWRDAVERFADGGPAEHPALATLGMEAVKALLPLLLTVIEAQAAALEASGPSEAANAAIMSAAARLLDPAAPEGAVRAAAHAWSARHVHALANANAELRILPATAFPAVAYVALVRTGARQPSELEKRLRIIWAVMRGRL